MTPSGNVVQIKDFLPPKPQRRRGRQQSQYELYPLPFFNVKKLSTWDVTPTGDYVVDCETGRAYAVEFLKSCDGTVGWSTMLGCIVADMIRAGPTGAFPSGRPKVNGMVLGFMRVISSILDERMASP